MITYSLDSEDVLVDIGGDWETFARLNGGASLTRRSVVGKPLFRFFDGVEIAEFYRSLFAKVRRGQHAISITIRCDGPSLRRKLMLRIEPRPNQGLGIRTEMLEESEREALFLLDPAAERSEEILTVCCVCGDVRSVEDRWIPIEEESARRRLLEHAVVPRLSHGYCPSCLSDQIRLLDLQH